MWKLFNFNVFFYIINLRVKVFIFIQLSLQKQEGRNLKNALNPKNCNNFLSYFSSLFLVLKLYLFSAPNICKIKNKFWIFGKKKKTKFGNINFFKNKMNNCIILLNSFIFSMIIYHCHENLINLCCINPKTFAWLTW